MATPVRQETIQRRLRDMFRSLVHGASSRDPNLARLLVNARIQVKSAHFYWYLKHYPLSLEQVLDIVREDPFIGPNQPTRVQRPEIFDCDNYAFHLRNLIALATPKKLKFPLALGCLMTDVHAWNVIAVDSRTVLLLDILDPMLPTSTDAFDKFIKRKKSDGRIRMIYM